MVTVLFQSKGKGRNFMNPSTRFYFVLSCNFWLCKTFAKIDIVFLPKKIILRGLDGKWEGLGLRVPLRVLWGMMRTLLLWALSLGPLHRCGLSRLARVLRWHWLAGCLGPPPPTRRASKCPVCLIFRAVWLLGFSGTLGSHQGPSPWNFSYLWVKKNKGQARRTLVPVTGLDPSWRPSKIRSHHDERAMRFLKK